VNKTKVSVKQHIELLTKSMQGHHLPSTVYTHNRHTIKSNSTFIVYSDSQLTNYITTTSVWYTCTCGSHYQ